MLYILFLILTSYILDYGNCRKEITQVFKGHSIAFNIEANPMETNPKYQFKKTKSPRNKKKIPAQTKIVGGKQIEITKVPYLVTVVDKGTKAPFCGGTILTKTHILTVAHCIEKKKLYSILAGSSNINGAGGVFKDVLKTTNHPKFLSNENDISILTLKFPLHFTKTIQKIALPKAKETFKKRATALVAGFGQTGEGKHQPRKLRGVDVTIFDMAECKKMVDPYVPKTLCAGHIKGGKGSCVGDSGGALVYNKKVFGIVSYSTGCARPRSPGVYTDVREFLDFIKKETKIKVFKS